MNTLTPFFSLQGRGEKQTGGVNILAPFFSLKGRGEGRPVV
ncbi:hypothetical protein [Pseudenterobacter timonensis]|nr:hypothetical protein [Pseudenterobacter timonensis]